MDESFETEEEEKIYKLILKKPGLHLTNIATLLDIKILEVERHLHCLEEKGLISSKSDKGYRTFYVEKKSRRSQYRNTSDTQRIVYELIQKNPGLHLSKIARMLNMSPALAEYHLIHLEKDKLIESVKDEGGYFKRFYLTEIDVGIYDKKTLALLRRELPLKIVLLLLQHKVLKHKEIAEKLDVVPSTLSHHLNNLLKNGIIVVQSYGAEKGYKIENIKEVRKFLLRYVLIDGFKDLWDDFKVV